MAWIAEGHEAVVLSKCLDSEAEGPGVGVGHNCLGAGEDSSALGVAPVNSWSRPVMRKGGLVAPLGIPQQPRAGSCGLRDRPESPAGTQFLEVDIPECQAGRWHLGRAGGFGAASFINTLPPPCWDGSGDNDREAVRVSGAGGVRLQEGGGRAPLTERGRDTPGQSGETPGIPGGLRGPRAQEQPA